MSTLPVPVERCEDGYRPLHEYRFEDCYIWHNRKPGKPRSIVPVGQSGPWILRINNNFSAHPTLKAARIDAARQMGLQLRPEDI